MTETSPQVGHQTLPQVDYWGGDIEKTSFDQVIFSSCGRIFKKGIAWDGKSSWMVFGTKEGIFQWSMTEDCPSQTQPITLNVNSLWWNFQAWERYNGEEPNDPDKIVTRIKVFAGQWNGSWSKIPFQWDLVSDEDTTKEVSENDPILYTPQDQDYKFYKDSFPLRELPIYNSGGGGKTWEDFEGWTHCLEEPDWVEDLLSEQKEEREQEEEQEEEQGEEDLMKKKYEAEERARQLFQEEEVREDPFDGGLYTKEEFVDYYGTTLQWDFMTEEKTFKRGILGKWILENGEYMRPEATNYLLDKMIETFN